MKNKNTRLIVLFFAAGILMYFLSIFVSDSQSMLSEDEEGFFIQRNPCGMGDHQIFLEIEGIGERPEKREFWIGEEKLSEEEGEEIISEAAESLMEEILGENHSLNEVRTGLELREELPDYGLKVRWDSEDPEILTDSGDPVSENIPESGTEACLRATLSNGIFEDTIEIPIRLYPPLSSPEDRLEEMICSRITENADDDKIRLPDEFEGKPLSYRDADKGGTSFLLFMGPVSAFLLYLNEKEKEKKSRKERENRLLLDYSELVSRFAVLTGAGFTIRQVFQKLGADSNRKKKKIPDYEKFHPVYEEIKITLHQIETGIPEKKAFQDFGKRCGLRPYLRFSSLLSNHLDTGGTRLRPLLEEEAENALFQRKEIARQMGEEASGKLMFPLIMILIVVMVMITAPAFMMLI